MKQSFKCICMYKLTSILQEEIELSSIYQRILVVQWFRGDLWDEKVPEPVLMDKYQLEGEQPRHVPVTESVVHWSRRFSLQCRGFGAGR